MRQGHLSERVGLAFFQRTFGEIIHLPGAGETCNEVNGVHGRVIRVEGVRGGHGLGSGPEIDTHELWLWT